MTDESKLRELIAIMRKSPYIPAAQWADGLEAALALPAQTGLRSDWKQAILGLSWIPLNYRHDVIRNIEALEQAGASEPEQVHVCDDSYGYRVDGVPTCGMCGKPLAQPVQQKEGADGN